MSGAAVYWRRKCAEARAENDALLSDNQAKCLELAEKAGEIRELEARVERLREGLRRLLQFAEELINVEEHVIWEEPAEISLNETICEARALLSDSPEPEAPESAETLLGFSSDSLAEALTESMQEPPEREDRK